MLKHTIAFLSVLLIPAAALAHGGAEHVMGTISAVTETSIVVETKSGKVTASIDAKTAVLRGDKAITSKDLKIGERVAVHAKEGANEALTAVTIKVGDASAPHSDHTH